MPKLRDHSDDFDPLAGSPGGKSSGNASANAKRAWGAMSKSVARSLSQAHKEHSEG